MSLFNRFAPNRPADDLRADLAGKGGTQALDSDASAEPLPAAAVDFDDLSADPTGTAVVRAVPFIGGLPLAAQQTALALMVIIGLIGLLGITTVSLLRARSGALEALDAGQAQAQAQRLAKAAAQAVLLDGRAFAELGESNERLGATVAELQGRTAAGNPEADAALQQALPLIERARGYASRVLAQQAPLVRAASADGAGGRPEDIAGLLQAREAQRGIANDSEPLRHALDTLQARIAEGSSFGTWSLLSLLFFLLLFLAGAAGFVDLFVREQAARAALAEGQRREAQRQEREAKRVNDANQAAILRLMNELQTVSEGDLTQQATVTEDITGAIADSVNYTVDELRALVSQVQGTVERVTATTAQVEANSTELLATSTEQLREIRDTGESVLQMAGRINNVSAQAQQTANVARQSLQAAESGLRAVQNSIGGMNMIRDQMQETSKRIKRLGESSQEIGDITELISDITEQTNVLALNAAIQAASAGDAGRGFSVVAQEVQRLAVRSADATRQISALVKTIQADTQDAVSAVESSTQNVVEGARLTDAAGGALGDIDRVSRRLSELIVQISNEALSEANSANVVAVNIQHIFAVTEQTSEGTRSTAQIVRELAKSADELKRSVARFKIV